MGTNTDRQRLLQEDANKQVPFLNQQELEALAARYFARKHMVEPDLQDAATFCASEAMEMVDAILRSKPYVRNHAKDPTETLGKECAQCLMMLIVTCRIGKVDLSNEMIKLVTGIGDLYG